MIYLNLVKNRVSIEEKDIPINEISINDMILLFGNALAINEDKKYNTITLKYDLLQFCFVEKSIYTFSIKLYFSDKQIVINEKLISKYTKKEELLNLKKYEQLSFQFQSCFQDEFGWLYIFDEETKELLEVMKRF